jgi:hypothetical protein
MKTDGDKNTQAPRQHLTKHYREVDGGVGFIQDNTATIAGKHRLDPKPKERDKKNTIPTVLLYQRSGWRRMEWRFILNVVLD